VIDLPLLDPIISILGPQAAAFATSGRRPARTGSRSATTSPRNVFRTRDGRYLSISASIQAMAERLLTTIGHADMLADPRFATNTARVANAEACEAPIAAFIAERDLAEVLAIFNAAEITAAPVYDIDQLMEDPHVIDREILLDLPDAELGQVAMHSIVPRLTATPGAIRSPAPRLGEHSAEILATLGVNPKGFAALVEKKITRQG
jgi:crotonobetainyl-CoA:carnitine CoA-transferase CaiB-like acyl-CoA transferase